MTQRLRVALAVTLATVAALAPLDAQETIALSGSIISSEEGTPLARAGVEVLELNRMVRSNQAGVYRFESISPGTYTIQVRYLGHSVAVDTVTVTTGENRLDFEMDRFAMALPAIEILRDRTEMGRGEHIPGAVSVVAREDRDESGLLFDDVHEVLASVPGVNIQAEDGYGLRPNIGLRGTGTERSSKITLMEDGVLIAPAPYAAPSAYYFPVTGRMSLVEVRKGSSQIRYGPNTVGGAINLVSSPIPETTTLAGDAAGGQDNSSKLYGRVGSGYGNFGWLVEAYQTGTNGFKELETGAPTGFDIQDFNLKLRFNTDHDASIFQSLEFKAGYYDELSNETYLGLTERDFGRSPNRRYAASQRDVMNADHSQLMVRHFLRPSSRFDVTTTVYRNEFSRNWYKLQSVAGQSLSSVLSDPESFASEVDVLRGVDSGDDALFLRANARDYYSQGIQSTIAYRFDGLGAAHNLEFGLRYHRDEEDRFQHEDGYRMEGGSMILTSAGSPGSQSNRVSDASAVSFYAEDEIQVGGLSLIPGVRFEGIELTRTDYAGDDPSRLAATRVRTNSVTAWIPGIGAALEVTPGISVFGGVHRGFGPPGPGSEEDTQGETSTNYEVGSRVNVGGLEAQVVGFFSDYGNILGAATLSSGGDGSGDQFNGGDVDVLGLEASLTYDPLFGRNAGLSFPLTISSTITRAEFQNSFDSDFDAWGSVEAGDELPYLPRVRMHASAGLAAALWNVSINADYSSAMRTVAGQGALGTETTDEYLILNASGEFEIAASARAFVGMRNITDRAYIVARRPAGLRPGLPRTLVAGVKIGT